MNNKLAVLKDKVRNKLSQIKQTLSHSESIQESPVETITDAIFLDPYSAWIKQQGQSDPKEVRQEIQEFAYKPKISIVVPVYNIEEKWLSKMIDSVLDQSYPYWELCLADDHSSMQETRDVLSKYAASDPRIKVIYRKDNGHISAATNSALSLATGDYIGFMDHDDEIEPNTLFEYVKAINEDPEIDLIYSDQDLIDTKGKRSLPFIKQNYNPRLLLSHNYISHFLVVSRELLEKVGELRSAFDGSQDYDFTLRATEKAKKVHHVPKILYHWRQLEGSVAEDSEAKDYAYTAGAKAITESLKRRNIPATASISENYGTNEIKGQTEPLVSILLINNGRESSSKTLKRILENTSYSNYEIIAVNFEEDEVEDKDKDKVIFYYNNKPITRNELYEYALKKAHGDYLLFIEPGAMPEDDDWLTNLVSETVIPETGIVGGMVLTPDRKLLNAGMALDPASDQILYTHRDVEVTPDNLGYYFRLGVPQNVMAVSSVCLLIDRDLYDEIGGLYKHYDRPMLDVDLSYRALKNGKRTVFNPNTKIIWEEEVKDVPADSIKPEFYVEGLPYQITDFRLRFEDEDIDDPYTQDLVKRFRRATSPVYSGPEELKNV